MGIQQGAYGYRKDELTTRLRRLEGQVRGIIKMVDEEQYCVDILTQIAAVQSALEKVSLGVLEDHVKGCVAEASGSERGPEVLDELVGVLERFVALRR
jgi:CsoR family transcriptional regulator, copper-sensing transcriptional repressor